MAYIAEINRANPSCFLFLIDQSSSMADPFGGAGSGRSKAQGVADAINRLLQNLILKCTKSEEVPWDYYDIGVIGYRQPKEDEIRVGSAFASTLAERDLVPISQVATNHLRIEPRTRKVDDDAGGTRDETFKFAVWVDPITNGGTPMCEALRYAYRILEGWVGIHPNSYPPIVINITDGEATDGDPLPEGERIKTLATSDGNVLFFNCHVSSLARSPMFYPDSEAGLPDQYAQLLFRMSSVLPPGLLAAAQAEGGFVVGAQAHGFVFNAELVDLIRFLDIGTRSNLR